MGPGKENNEIQRYIHEAIAYATNGRWQEAVSANKAILELSPLDVDAYNRLGRALMKQGEYIEAKEAYNRALELDPYNSIAIKNLDRLSHLTKMPPTTKVDQRVSLDIFITEAGKTGVVNLTRLAPKEIVANAAPGEEVALQVEGQRLLVHDSQGEYLGEVDPKYGLRLIKLINGGNRYVAAINSLGENNIKVIIREVYQHPSQMGRLSFPQQGKEAYRPYTRESLFRRRLEEEETAEEDEETSDEESDGFSITDFYEFPFADKGSRESAIE